MFTENYFVLCEFFTSVLADGLSLEFEWQQVSSGLQDSSQYSGWSQQCCSLVKLDSSLDFQYFQSPFQAFGDCSKCTNYNWYHYHPPVPQLFLVLWPGPSICLSFHSLSFSFCGSLEWQNLLDSKLFFSCSLTLSYYIIIISLYYYLLLESFLHEH